VGKILEDWLKQRRFESTANMTMLNILVASDQVNKRMGESLKGSGVTPPQYNVLRILKGAGSLGMARRAIAERTIFRNPDVTRLLDRLEAGGLVERFGGSEDRRTSMARITPAGLELLERLSGPIREATDAVVANLTDEEQHQLTVLLEKLYRAK